MGSGSPRGKVAQNEEFYHVVLMSWACAKNHVIYNPLRK